MMKTQKAPKTKYDLPEKFYANPHIASATITSKQLKELMLGTSGFIVANGSFWSIKKKSLGAGTYNIWVEENERGSDPVRG